MDHVVLLKLHDQKIYHRNRYVMKQQIVELKYFIIVSIDFQRQKKDLYLERKYMKQNDK